MAPCEKCIPKESAPPGRVAEGLVRLYSMRFCPYAQRARLILVAKGIKHETININLKNKPDWFFEKSPFGSVPVIECPNGKVIYESAIICEYLDEAFPEKTLMPSDPYEKAKQKMLLEHYSKTVPYFYSIAAALRNKEDASKQEEEFKKKLTYLDGILEKQKTQFFGGDSVSMIDYMIWPWFERIQGFQLQHCLQHTSNLSSWVSRMKEDAAVKATMTCPDTFKTFYNLYTQGSLEACDYGL
ncbi:glutathione S-transferase omega-2 [Polypterus senegalus]|uniref:glutathione S-transferase omega-2 n=1 Tax=Polypterus senegalus TaxID=55291 RepID=UPI001964B37D|nr:glutathione S-transferase omega-2 [Polypterus senegalus]